MGGEGETWDWKFWGKGSVVVVVEKRRCTSITPWPMHPLRLLVGTRYITTSQRIKKILVISSPVTHLNIFDWKSINPHTPVAGPGGGRGVAAGRQRTVREVVVDGEWDRTVYNIAIERGLAHSRDC